MPQQSNWLVPPKYQNWLGMVILSVAGWVLVRHLSAWKDLAFGDETTYLASGITFAIPFTGGAQWGPLYAAWYAFWHLFIPDRLDLYYFNYGLLSVLAGVLVFVYLRSSKVAFWPSVWIAVLFLFSSQNLPLDPKISIAPFCLILAGLSITQFFDFKNWHKMLIVAFVGLLCAYCRPEFYIAFLIATALAIWFLWAQRAIFSKAVFGPLALFGVGVAVLHLLFQNPLFSGDGSRSAVAFQQHFVINYTQWNALPNPNTIEAQLKLYHQVFGSEVESITDALQSKPDLVLKHVLTNVGNTLLANARNVLDIFYQTPLLGWYSRWRMLAFGVVFLAFLACIDYRQTRPNKLKNAFNGVDLLALTVLIFPALVAAILVYPRTHYLVFHVLLLLWIAGLFTQLIVFKSFRWAGITSALVLAFFLTWRYSLFSNAPTPSADNVRFINQLRYQKEVVSLEREWYRVFLKEPAIWAHVEQYQYANGDFTQFVRQQGINFILMTRDMQQYFAKDAGFAAFEASVQKEGFVKLTTNPQGEYLLVKSDLIKR